jgi:hypothetical protein
MPRNNLSSIAVIDHNAVLVVIRRHSVIPIGQRGGLHQEMLSAVI